MTQTASFPAELEREPVRLVHPDLATRECACSSLRAATRSVTQLYDDALRPFDLKATQFSLLTAVRAQGPVTIKRLAEAGVMDRTTLTRNLRPLERRGWVRIVRGTDRRERVVHLSREGQRILEQAMPAWRLAQRRMSELLGGSRLERMLKDLAATVEATWTA
ncbi:MAG: MarR family winged helix-turn-helix transcriptional regulator [Myxococcota bacterium]